MFRPVSFLPILLVMLNAWEITQSLNEEPALTNCDSTKCVLPNCLCMSTSPPMGLLPEEIPQMVFITFDDAIGDWMYPTYAKIFGNRTNPNGCDIGMTFYVTHEGTNYRLVNEFFNRGNEIASHTVTHKNDYPYWTNSSVDFWKTEAGRQRNIINTYSNVPLDKIQGFRAPYLQTGGDATFTALQSLGMNFDSSLPSINFMDPPIWPFTMDFGITHDCVILPCGNETHPGFWDVPMVALQSGQNGSVCSMADSCLKSGNLTAQEIFDYFMFNFERYNKTRAPFGIYQHIYWIVNEAAVLDGFVKFLDYLTLLDYVYIIPVSKGMEWMRNPVTLEQMKVNNTFSCDPSSIELAPCPEPQICHYNESIPGGERSMGSCVPCPVEYPWLEDRSVSTPVSTTPVSTTPVSTTPVSTTPVSTTPVSTTPVSTTPVSTTPFSSSVAAKQPEIIAVISSILTIISLWIH